MRFLGLITIASVATIVWRQAAIRTSNQRAVSAPEAPLIARTQQKTTSHFNALCFDIEIEILPSKTIVCILVGYHRRGHGSNPTGNWDTRKPLKYSVVTIPFPKACLSTILSTKARYCS